MPYSVHLDLKSFFSYFSCNITDDFPLSTYNGKYIRLLLDVLTGTIICTRRIFGGLEWVHAADFWGLEGEYWVFLSNLFFSKQKMDSINEIFTVI